MCIYMHAGAHEKVLGTLFFSWAPVPFLIVLLTIHTCISFLDQPACDTLTKDHKQLYRSDQTDQQESWTDPIAKVTPLYVARDCRELYEQGHNSGVYTIKPDDLTAFEVLFDDIVAHK